MRTVRQMLEGKGNSVFAIEPEAPVLKALQRMAEHHVGALLVMSGDTLHGVMSERDYARKVILKGRSSGDTPVRDIMTAPVQTIGPDRTVHGCMRLMTEQRIRHLPVTENGKVIGVLSIGDLVKAVIEDQQQEIEQLQHYISG